MMYVKALCKASARTAYMTQRVMLREFFALTSPINTTCQLPFFQICLQLPSILPNGVTVVFHLSHHQLSLIGQLPFLPSPSNPPFSLF